MAAIKEIQVTVYANQSEHYLYYECFTTLKNKPFFSTREINEKNIKNGVVLEEEDTSGRGSPIVKSWAETKVDRFSLKDLAKKIKAGAKEYDVDTIDFCFDIPEIFSVNFKIGYRVQRRRLTEDEECEFKICLFEN